MKFYCSIQMRIICLMPIIVFATNVWANDMISGSMKCKLKSNQITVLNEGKPHIFSHFTNGLRVGDYLSIEYRVSQIAGSFEESKVSIWIGRDDPHFTLFYTQASQPEPDWNSYSIGKGVLVKDGYGSIYVTPNMARFESLDFGVVDIRRYYKSDWHGIGFDKITAENAPDLQARIFSLDCRHTQDAWDLFISKLRVLSQD